MSKKNKFLTGLIILIALLFATKQWYKVAKKDPVFYTSDSTLIAIDGDKVGKEEYLLHLRREIAMTYNYFYQNYGIEKSPAFWTTPVANQIPMDYLKERTNKKLIASKTIHALAKKYNIITGFNFEEFKIHWQEYNKNRKETHDRGEVVYGSIYTDMPSYYHYLLSNLAIRVKDKVIKTEFAANENILRRFYETVKQDQFSYFESIEIEVFGFEYNILPFKTAMEKMEVVKKHLDNGMSFKKDLETKFPPGVYQQKIFYDSIPIYGEDNPDEIIRQHAQGLKLNEYKMVKAQEGVYIINLKSASEEQYHPFEKVEKQLIQYYQDEQYNAFLDSLINNAHLEKNYPKYEQISESDFSE